MTMTTIVQLISIPVLSAITGYVTNTIAVRMLFRPRTPWRILGFEIQGLIPKRRPQIARKIGETVQEHLISHDDIRKVLSDDATQAKVHQIFDKRVDVLLQTRLKTVHPMVGMFLNDQVSEKLKALIMEEVTKALEPITENVMESLEEHLDFKQLVIAKIEEFDLDRFEQIVLNIARRELRAIEILGGVLGFIIGLGADLLLLID